MNNESLSTLKKSLGLSFIIMMLWEIFYLTHSLVGYTAHRLEMKLQMQAHELGVKMCPGGTIYNYNRDKYVVTCGRGEL